MLFFILRECSFYLTRMFILSLNSIVLRLRMNSTRYSSSRHSRIMHGGVGGHGGGPGAAAAGCRQWFRVLPALRLLEQHVLQQPQRSPPVRPRRQRRARAAGSACSSARPPCWGPALPRLPKSLHSRHAPNGSGSVQPCRANRSSLSSVSKALPFCCASSAVLV